MQIPMDQLFSFLFLLTRCSGVFVFTPFFGSLNLPVQIRILLSAAISYLFALNFTLPIPAGSFTMAGMLIGLSGELLVGLAIGFAAHVIFAGLECAGQIIGFQIGLSLVNTVDPQTSNRSTVLSVYQTQFGLMLFLGLNAHHWFIRAIADSLTVLPPFSMAVKSPLIYRLADMSAQVFVIGFQIAAPVVAVLILADVALGFVGRSAPQIHILVIGMPLKVLAGISALGLGLYFFPAAFRVYSERLHHDMGDLIRLLHR